MRQMPLTQPSVHLLPHILLLRPPLRRLLAHALLAQALLGPVDADDALESLERAAEPVVVQCGLDHERHPLLCEHVCARHVARGRDGEEDGREVRDEVLLERGAARGDGGREERVRRAGLEV